MNYDQRIELARQAQILLLERMTVIPIQADWTMYALKANVRDFHVDHYGYIIPGDIWFEK